MMKAGLGEISKKSIGGTIRLNTLYSALCRFRVSVQFLIISSILTGLFYSNVNAQSLETSPVDLEFNYFYDLEGYSSSKYFASVLKQCGSAQLSEYKKYLCNLADSKVELLKSNDFGKYIERFNDVLFFGERHVDYEAQNEFAGILHVLHKQGYNTLAMEMFPASTQDHLDLYSQDQLSLDNLMTVLKEHWNYKNDGYRVILKTAKKLKMRIVGIDDRTKISNVFWSDLFYRDDVMAQNLTLEYLASGQQKMVVYTGRLHATKSFGSNPQIQSLSQKLKNNLQSYGLDIHVQNYIFRLVLKGKAYKHLLNLHVQHDDQTTMVSSDYFKKYIDGTIYLNPEKKSNLSMASLDN